MDDGSVVGDNQMRCPGCGVPITMRANLTYYVEGEDTAVAGDIRILKVWCADCTIKKQRVSVEE